MGARVAISGWFVLWTAFLVPPVASAQDAAQAPEPEPLNLSADVRLRLEADSRSGTGVDDDSDTRTRPRLRARLGATYQTPVDGVSFGLRIATNAGTPGNSPHQTFDADVGADHGNVFELDRAYVRYEPGAGAFVVAGKQGFPHWQQTEVFWDEDIQPEGFLAGIDRSLGEAGTASVRLGHFYLSNNGYDSRLLRNDDMTTWQVSYKGAFDMFEPRAAVTGLHMNDKAGITNTDGVFQFVDASFFMGSVQLKVAMEISVTVGVDVLFSTADADNLMTDPNSGFVAQGRLGYRDYGARYYYYRVEEAAAPFWGTASLSQDNFANSRGGGLTGFSGHRLQLDWKIGEGVSADLRVYLQKGLDDNILAFSETPGRTINRYQFNLNTKF